MKNVIMKPVLKYFNVVVSEAVYKKHLLPECSYQCDQALDDYVERFKNKCQYLMILGHFHILNFDHLDANLTFVYLHHKHYSVQVKTLLPTSCKKRCNF